MSHLISVYALLLLTSLALITPTLSQAPFDYDNYCRTFFRFADDHVFPEDVVILLDSYDYQALLEGTSPAWSRRDSDGDGEMWTQRGGLCQNDLRACSFAQPGPQSNWLFTQYISYEDAREVIFNVTFRFSQCTSNPGCTNDFVNVYRYDVTGIQDEARANDRANYLGNRMGVFQQGSNPSDTQVQWRLNRPTDSNVKGFYLAFEDTGTCGQIRRIISYHLRAPGFRDAANLVTCLDTALPPEGSGQLTTTTCSCDSNTAVVSALKRSCNDKGACVGSPACACKPGYELSSSGVCTACPAGTYKATVSNTDRCSPCPANSESLFPAAEVCECNCNTVRPANQPGADCSRPPSSPLITANNPPLVEENGLTIFWRPASDNGGHPASLHYNVYTYDSTTEEYVKANNNEIKQEPQSSVLAFTLTGIDGSVGVVVTSATVATGDEERIRDLNQVQNRFIQYYVTVKQSNDQCEDKTIDKTETAPVTEKEIEIPDPVEEIIDPVEGILTGIPNPLEPVDNSEDMVSPTPEPTLFFSLGSAVYTNGSTVSLSEIELGDSALLCKTDSPTCCRDSFQGEFYYPDGSLVPVRAAGQSVYRNRGDGFIRLNHVGTQGTPLGQYRCEVPDSSGKMQKLFVTIQ